jgi:hypothetical protein
VERYLEETKVEGLVQLPLDLHCILIFTIQWLKAPVVHTLGHDVKHPAA